ncbi:MAG: zinc-dependent metalloprotease [Propionibacterium sp.]|nr:zinc-dependent metalloprotease [Propionibacterium sp.]
MSEPEDADRGQDAFGDFLRKMLGDQAGEEASRAMREQGFDASAVNRMFTDPSQMDAMLGQFQYLLGRSDGPVNWQMAEDMAKQQAFQSGDDPLSAAEAERARQAMTVADLWLDAVTAFSPGPLVRRAWTRVDWVGQTLPMWKRITEPVAQNVSRALTDALSSQLGGATDGSPLGLPDGLPPEMAAMVGRTQQMMPRLASMVFAMQIGQALAALSQEAMGSTDVGLPLVAEGGTTALVVRNVAAFGEGLDIPFDELQQFMAVRECAHARLFASVPWLVGDLLRAVESYSAEIAIDTDAIAEAARGMDPSDPASVNEAMSHGVFAPEPTQRQRTALGRLETLLALVEGWVEVVTARAVAPYLPHAEQLREMMRRRRASGGPAEQVLGQLIGLRMRPRRARGAARVFDLVEQAQGRDAREALWAHPDMVPTTAELDDPASFLPGRAAAADQDAEIDAALTELLEGTLGWAEGLTPEIDPESESLRRAGFAVPEVPGGTSPDEGDATSTGTATAESDGEPPTAGQDTSGNAGDDASEPGVQEPGGADPAPGTLEDTGEEPTDPADSSDPADH